MKGKICSFHSIATAVCDRRRYPRYPTMTSPQSRQISIPTVVAGAQSIRVSACRIFQVHTALGNSTLPLSTRACENEPCVLSRPLKALRSCALSRTALLPAGISGKLRTRALGERGLANCTDGGRHPAVSLSSRMQTESVEVQLLEAPGARLGRQRTGFHLGAAQRRHGRSDK